MRTRVLGPLALALLASACFDASLERPRAEDARAASAASDRCIAPLTPIEPVVPWKNAEELCAQAKRGEPWRDATPPLGPGWIARTDAYAERVQTFLRSLAYRTEPYAWLHDASWRLTGPYEGCPPNGDSDGPHPAVRIYYSPEVIDWMCRYRRGDEQPPDAADMPDGAVIIKEMIDPGSTKLALVPGTDQLWIAPLSEKPEDSYDATFTSWTIMIKASRGSSDGWYTGFFARDGSGNPPIQDRAAFTSTTYPGSDGQPVRLPPGNEWYPTYWNYSVDDVQFPNYEFGNYCVYCHASAQGELTFSSFTNLLGREIRYRWFPSAQAVDVHDDHDRRARAVANAARRARDKDPRAPFPAPRAWGNPLPGFTAFFPELAPAYPEIWASRLPSRTWDHAESRLGVPGVPAAASQFLTSDQCEGCHEAGGSGQLDLPYMVVQKGDVQVDLAPFAEWSVSPMGLAGRDPIFHSQLELERNLARTQPALAGALDCIDNLCLHCHGAAGARQLNIDTAGQGPKDKTCSAFLPPPGERRAADLDGKLFTQSMVFAWRDENPELATYGGLARDGVTCTICHHVADVDLDPANLPRTFTGNFRVGRPDRIFGPFPNPGSPEDVRVLPMQHALSLTPERGAQVQTSELCGTCHTVYLPVLDERGAVAGSAYEQTTYLEWLLSDFAYQGSAQQTCQDCHMPGAYDGRPLRTGIANVQDTRYPKADFLLAGPQVDVPERPYRRHQLYGLNAFLNAFVQQFPLELGFRQQDFMNPNVRAPLIEGRNSVLQVAREQTAELRLDALEWRADALEARVSIRNLGGHNLPSGVGFRRLFVELQVLDAAGRSLWASGRTSDIGVLLEGTSDRPLATELGLAGPSGLPFQPHQQRIERQDQVQIYEERVQNSSLEPTSSFLHRYWTIKDNRLRPRGWLPSRIPDPARRDEYAFATRPGTGPERAWWPEPKTPVRYRNPKFPAIAGYRDTAGDPDYDLAAHPTTGLPGSDSLVYAIRLSPEQRAQARRVQVTLYSQSIPPQFLKERFVAAARPGAERSAASRLYYMTGNLDTSAPDGDGKPYLDGYKLRVGQPSAVDVPARP